MSCAASFATAGALPPHYRFRTLQESRIKVHFHQEVEGAARRVMALTLEILPKLEERYRVHVPSLDLVVQDALDAPNGLASSFPYPYVEIRTAGFDGADNGPTESWLRLVVTHELTHIVHIEQARGIYGFGRRVFGRAPFLFPDALQPTWFIEGLAVREETRGTSFGRGRHVYTKMLVDEAARSGQLAKMDQATLGLDLWPFGNAPYLFGEEFLAWLEQKRGEGITRDIAMAHASSLRPYLDGRTFRKVTGQSLGSLWSEFARERVSALPPARPARTVLTHRGTVQTAPRLSPDGKHLAYTSRTLNRLGEIRLMSKDGSADRSLARRISGSALSWSRDGAFIVFDETNVVRKFESRSDLHRVDLRTGKRTRLSTGLRASEPDIGPERGSGRGPSIVFVQRLADRTELAVMGMGVDPGHAARKLTTSAAGVEWSHPRFSPSGDVIVASRLSDGFLDLVLVDPETGEVTGLTHDRALDAEPAWVDERTVIFRSDREANSFRLFLIDRDGSALRALKDSPDNAFVPEPDRASDAVFYARYGSTGFDIATTALGDGDPVPPFVDPFPPLTEEPAPYEGEAKSYNGEAALWPRFVTPYTEIVSDEWRVGLATASFDPLLRTTYGVAASLGLDTHDPNALAYLRYDRFTPTFTLFGRRESSPSGASVLTTHEVRASVDFPLERSALRSQTVDLTVRRRRETEDATRLDTGTLAAIWIFDSTKRYPMSISPTDGLRLRTAVTRELKALGSDLDFGKVIVDGRGYLGVGKTVVALRLGAGWTYGAKKPRNAYYVGGLANPALLDPVGDEPAVLRGYETPDVRDSSRYGTKLAFGNLDWRIPLAHPQRGVRAYPFFLQHLHLAASLDAAVVSASTLNLRSARVGASLGLGADVLIGHRIPLTVQGGIGRGLNRDRGTVPWFSIGFPF